MIDGVPEGKDNEAIPADPATTMQVHAHAVCVCARTGLSAGQAAFNAS
ncbi:hypothetical protein [Pseudochelatococcus sp. G4_1912]